MSGLPRTTPHLLVSGAADFRVPTYDRDMAKPVPSNVANKLHHCVLLLLRLLGLNSQH
jgi:hypothetical protein